MSFGSASSCLYANRRTEAIMGLCNCLIWSTKPSYSWALSSKAHVLILVNAIPNSSQVWSFSVFLVRKWSTRFISRSSAVFEEIYEYGLHGAFRFKEARNTYSDWSLGIFLHGIGCLWVQSDLKRKKGCLFLLLQIAFWLHFKKFAIDSHLPNSLISLLHRMYPNYKYLAKAMLCYRVFKIKASWIIVLVCLQIFKIFSPRSILRLYVSSQTVSNKADNFHSGDWAPFLHPSCERCESSLWFSRGRVPLQCNRTSLTSRFFQK